ncbi:MAG TPA: AAA family ATPase [bacterium]|nr:AAA family ATPase [bacterium]
MGRRNFLKRVSLRNYKSIAECDVDLGALTFLVGRNGAGKSNFLDALHLVTESLTSSLDHALRNRGGINEVRRRSSGHPTHFQIRLDIQTDLFDGYYSFRIGAKSKGGFEVQKEECLINKLLRKDSYRVEEGTVIESSAEVMPPASPDRLYLVSAAGLPEFRPVFDALSHMGFYNLNPDAIRELQTPDTGEVLRRDGSNLASVLSVMEKESPESRKYVVDFLSKVVPGISDVSSKRLRNKETLDFRQQVGSNKASWPFSAQNMSDGTLRALGVLTAIFQSNTENGSWIPLVGIEEPETAVHPGAAAVLRDALRVASASKQVLVTSHSPDLLDDKDIEADEIVAVENDNGKTLIGPLTETDRGLLKDKLFTAGELLRQGGLLPDREKASRVIQENADGHTNS